jgi:ribosomal protein S18 acetylase RimI-like enzyme
VHIRPALLRDKEFILDLAQRLVEFGTVPGREPLQMVARDRAVLVKALEQPSASTALFVAETAPDRCVGFIHLTTADDYYTDSLTGHIADVVVAPQMGGHGVGSALIAYAEEWARTRGFAMLTLNVFTANHRARELYTRAGFQEEWIRCIKRLQP